MTDTDHYVIPRTGWAPLRDLLASIPAVLDDLAVTLTRQDRIGTSSLGSSGDPTQPLPINLAASDAHDDLRGELATWVKHTAKHRRLQLPVSGHTLELARWLSRHLIDLAQTPEADIAHDRIERCIRDCKRTYDRPPTKTYGGTIEEAQEALLNKRGIAACAKQLGDDYASLTIKRVENLARRGHIIPITRIDRDTILYRMGDVMAAHTERPLRGKMTA